MTLQTAAPITSLSLNTSNRPAWEVARLAQDGHIDLNSPYQRGSVWTTEQRMELVRSWLAGVPVPAVTLNDRSAAARTARQEHDGPAYAAVDGKQRIETAVAWFGDDLRVPASWFSAEDVLDAEDTSDGPYVRFSGLSTAAQRGFRFSASLPVIETRLLGEQAEAEVYVLLERSGSPQTTQDVRRAEAVAGV